jgi:hypothetical protein
MFRQTLFTDLLANIQMELKLRFIFIISCWPRGPTPYRIRRCPDWGYLGADKFERGLSQVPGPTRIRPKIYTKFNNFMFPANQIKFDCKCCYYSYLRYKCKKLSFIARTGLKYEGVF